MIPKELFTSLSKEEFLKRLKSIPHSSFGESFLQQLKFATSSSKTNLLTSTSGFILTHKGKWFGSLYRNVTCELQPENDRTKIRFTSRLNKVTRTILLSIISIIVAMSVANVFSQLLSLNASPAHIFRAFGILFLISSPLLLVITLFIRSGLKKEVVFMLEDLIKELESIPS